MPASTGQFGHDFDLAGLAGDFRADSWARALSQGSSYWGEAYSGCLWYYADQGQYWLIVYRVGETLALFYKVDGPDLRPMTSLVSAKEAPVRDRSFVLMPDGATTPTDSFLDWPIACRGILDFLNDPRQAPTSINWVDIDAFEWPDSDY